jgi:hypothetical protein
MIEEFKWVSVTLAFVVPGIMLANVVSLFLPRRKMDEKVALLRYFFLTCIVFGVFVVLPRSWGTWPLFEQDGKSPSYEGLVTYFLALPILLGLILGLAGRKNLVGRVLGRLGGFNTLHALPSAWDYKFGHCQGAYLIVTLTDGTTFAGLWQDKSFAGDSDSRDLYLEKVFEIEGDAWKNVDRTDGVWIQGKEIRTVEFRTLGEQKQERQEKKEP